MLPSQKANLALRKSVAENPFPQELITNKEVLRSFSKTYEFKELLSGLKNVNLI